MCSIIGCFNNEHAFSRVQKGLIIMKERGKDGYGYYDGSIHLASSPEQLLPSTEKHILGHGLHAIVNVVPQPLEEKKAILVANCEIYNWKELAQEYKIHAKNDSDLLLKLLHKLGIEKTLPLLRGVYAFAYWEEDTLYLARDIIGVKPLWYHLDGKKLSFSSEKKALDETSQELNPRQILKYSLKTGKTSFLRRNFSQTKKILKRDVLLTLQNALQEAVRLEAPDTKFGLLFSGGLDSLLLAKMLKDLGPTFTCYTAATSEQSPDLMSAKECAKQLGFNLRYTILSPEQTVERLKKIVPLIEDSNVIKIGVALPLFVAAQLAKEDGNRVIFAGSGADELFGGYHRYKATDIKKLNEDCYSDILKIYEKNCYRDDVITMNNNLELRVPFLDKEVVSLALQIPPEWKIKDGQEKYILRQLAQNIGIPKELAERKKKAAQYGSGFDAVLEKLAKKEKKSKSKYLEQFYRPKNVRLAALVSGGKDSLYATYIMAQQNYEISCLVRMQSSNPDSYMFHTPNIHLVELQAQAMGVPLLTQKTTGEKETELKDLEIILKKAQEKYHIEGVVSGALYSQYQRERIEKVAEKLGLKVFAPLWHKDQEQELRELLALQFSFILSSIAAEGLDKSWLGKVLTDKDVDKLVALNKKVGLNVAFEGGEAESLVLNCPLFHKRIIIDQAEMILENSCTGRYAIQKAHLE
ncbi:diphthine--ammonia ligase [Candidatus Woesearchaeota archaeon]|nr:diphthine--ammonia ligase [Candidatus Woesearchaeota archaeon]